MKKLNNIILGSLLVTVITSSCKKDLSASIATGTVNVTNAVIGGATLTFTTNNNIISGSNTVNSNAATFFPVAGSGNVQVNLGVPAKVATATTPAVPAVVYYNQSLTFDNSTNYSLFLTGTSPSAVESVLIKESYPRTYTDSICGVRFINLTPGSNPISVNIKGQANGSEVSSLAYKAYGNFKTYPAKAVNKTIVFEIRDANTGALLFPTNGNGYTLNIPYFHNVTLCYRGTGTNVGIILNNDY